MLCAKVTECICPKRAVDFTGYAVSASATMCARETRIISRIAFSLIATEIKARKTSIGC